MNTLTDQKLWLKLQTMGMLSERPIVEYLVSGGGEQDADILIDLMKTAYEKGWYDAEACYALRVNRILEKIIFGGNGRD